MADTIHILLNEMAETIAHSRQLLANGEVVTLDALVPVAARLQIAFSNMTLEDRTQAMPQLNAVMDDLKALEEALRVRQNEVAEEMKQLGRQKQANTAYQATELNMPDGKKEDGDG